MSGSNLVDKRGVFLKKFLSYMKMSESAYLTYYQRNRDVIVNRAKDYYQNDKEWLREQARDKYRNLSQEEKTKKREYGKVDISICLEIRNKDWKNIKKIIARLKSLNIIMNKIVF